jgi:hypothetical protein
VGTSVRYVLNAGSFVFCWLQDSTFSASIPSPHEVISLIPLLSHGSSDSATVTVSGVAERAYFWRRSHLLAWTFHWSRLSLSLTVGASVARVNVLRIIISSFSSLSYGRSKASSKRALHIVRSRAFSLKWEYRLLSPRSSSSFLRLIPRLPHFYPAFVVPSITRCRRQFYAKCD